MTTTTTIWKEPTTKNQEEMAIVYFVFDGMETLQWEIVLSKLPHLPYRREESMEYYHGGFAVNCRHGNAMVDVYNPLFYDLLYFIPKKYMLNIQRHLDHLKQMPIVKYQPCKYYEKRNARNAHLPVPTSNHSPLPSTPQGMENLIRTLNEMNFFDD